MADAYSAQVEVKTQVPIEVCERIIEEVYDDRYELVQTALATLSSCAFVCRAWRPCAQSVLFKHVILRDKNALYQFTELLNASPELSTYVRTLELRGYLHVPYSTAVLFPTALRGKLPKLVELYIHDLGDDVKAANPLPEGQKELPSLPIHPYLPSLLASISHICRLDLHNIKFPSFGDLARILNTFSNVRELYCGWVSWSVFGQQPACMVRTDPHGLHGPGTFLPNLRQFKCYEMDECGIERLLCALGPSLRELYLKIPNKIPPRQEAEHPKRLLSALGPSLHEVYLEIPNKTASIQKAEHASKQEGTSPSVPVPVPVDLRFFPHLDLLVFFFEPLPQPPDATLTSLRDTLASWVLSGDHASGAKGQPSTQRRLSLRPYREPFKREHFVELLRAIGPMAQAALCKTETSEGVHGVGHQTGEDTGNLKSVSARDTCRAILVVEDLGDRLEWEAWWRDRILECFPTFSKLNQLEVYPLGTEYPQVYWKDNEQTPLLEVADTGPQHPMYTEQNTAPTTSQPNRADT